MTQQEEGIIAGIWGGLRQNRSQPVRSVRVRSQNRAKIPVLTRTSKRLKIS
ncbi:hypothetical protein CEB3_c39630 [Peptococcaceae bacterium CEB3]|nr:hypothetical protein CEB3_c39630 [Peptococcaceae bacterium CEB3]